MFKHGYSKAAIAREIGIDKRTVNKYLNCLSAERAFETNKMEKTCSNDKSLYLRDHAAFPITLLCSDTKFLTSFFKLFLCVDKSNERA